MKRSREGSNERPAKKAKKAKKFKKANLVHTATSADEDGGDESLNKKKKKKKSKESKEKEPTENTNVETGDLAVGNSRREEEGNSEEAMVADEDAEDIPKVPLNMRDAVVIPEREPHDDEDGERAAVETLPLSSAVVAALKEEGISRLFPVQSLVVPAVLATSGTAGGDVRQFRDVCVSAPTGSGKTLAYVVPVVETLHRRVLVRLRALVIVPTGELLRQVAGVFSAVCRHTSLSVGTAVGQSPFAQEAAALVDATTLESKVDILIATPGRLMDHVRETKGFTLKHLRYLVVDEMDRLLTQSYQSWLPEVLSSATRDLPVDSFHVDDSGRLQFDVGTARATAGMRGPATMAEPLQKLLFSATLAEDPAQVASLRLHRPRFFVSSSSGRPTVPGTLTERFVVCRLQDKPLALLHLLRANTPAICFAASVEAAHRLCRLIELFFHARAAEKFPGAWDRVEVEDGGQPEGSGPGTKKGKGKGRKGRKRRAGTLHVAEYTRDLSQAQRKDMVERFAQGGIDLMVCSDVMARGVDLDNVATVVNYDVPVYARTYVHRVGRTARAGNTGTAYTLLRRDEVRHFKQMVATVEGSSPKEVKVARTEWAPYAPRYENAAKHLGGVLEREARGADPLALSSSGDDEAGDADDGSAAPSEEAAPMDEDEGVESY